MTTRILVCFFVVSVCSQTVWGNSEAVLDAVASAFQFPKERLRIRDVSNSEDAKKNPKIKAGYFIDTSDNTFAHVQFLVTEPGSVLTPEVEERFRNALTEQRKIPNSKPNVRTLDFGSEVEGYVGMLGFGPGGSTTGAVLRVPGKYDLRMTVIENFESPVGSAPETDAYYQAFKADKEFLKDALGRASQNIANEIVAGRLRFGEEQAGSAAAATPLVTASISSSSPVAALSRTSPPMAAQVAEPAASPAGTRSRKGVIVWAFVLIGAAAIAGAIVWQRKRRRF